MGNWRSRPELGRVAGLYLYAGGFCRKLNANPNGGSTALPTMGSDQRKLMKSILSG
jgi:hypothetical protein